MMSSQELAANALATASIVLAARNNVHTWWTGIVGCGIFAVVFYQAHLFADVVLQVFFVGASVVGWWQWLRGDHGAPLPITEPPWTKLVPSVALGLLGTVAYGLLLHRFTSAYAPFADSSVLVFSLIAQLLLMRRRVHTWPFWLLVNTIAVPLYASRGLYLTSVLYFGYWVNAIVAWRSWRRLAREAAVAMPAAEAA